MTGLVLSAKALQHELGVSRAVAYDIARRLGVRVSERRIVVPVAALERWLADGGIDAPREGR